ncbi:hypothetical protein [Halomonas sp. WWR20]
MSAPLTRHDRPRQALNTIATANAHLAGSDRAARYAKFAESPYRFFRGTHTLDAGKPYRKRGGILAREHLRGSRSLNPDEHVSPAMSVSGWRAGSRLHRDGNDANAPLYRLRR